MYLESVVDKLLVNWHELYTEMKLNQTNKEILSDALPVENPIKLRNQQLRLELNEIVEAVVIIRTHKDND